MQASHRTRSARVISSPPAYSRVAAAAALAFFISVMGIGFAAENAADSKIKIVIAGAFLCILILNEPIERLYLFLLKLTAADCALACGLFFSIFIKADGKLSKFVEASLTSGINDFVVLFLTFLFSGILMFLATPYIKYAALMIANRLQNFYAFDRALALQTMKLIGYCIGMIGLGWSADGLRQLLISAT